MEQFAPLIPRPPDLVPFLKAATDALNRANIAIGKIDAMLFWSGFAAGVLVCAIILTAVAVFSRKN